MATTRKTTTKKTAASKPATPRKTAVSASKATAPSKAIAKPATTAAKTVTPVAKPVVKTPVSGVTAPLKTVMRKKRLIDMVVSRSGIKKKDAKPVVEATLAVLGEALAGDEELNLTPMGKVKVQRRMDKPNATVMVARIRQPKANYTAPKDPLAKAAE